jgi:hypothetical protein
MIFCGRVNGKEKLIGVEEFVQGGKNKAGLYPAPLFSMVEFQDVDHIFRKIQEDTFSYFIACATGTPAPGGNGNSPFGSIFHHLDDIPFMSGLHDPQRPDPI